MRPCRAEWRSTAEYWDGRLRGYRRQLAAYEAGGREALNGEILKQNAEFVQHGAVL